MSHWAVRMCSSRCQGVYGRFGARRLIASAGKSFTASSNGRWAPWPSMSCRSCSRTTSRSAIFPRSRSAAARTDELPGVGSEQPEPAAQQHDLPVEEADQTLEPVRRRIGLEQRLASRKLDLDDPGQEI